MLSDDDVEVVQTRFPLANISLLLLVISFTLRNSESGVHLLG